MLGGKKSALYFSIAVSNLSYSDFLFLPLYDLCLEKGRAYSTFQLLYCIKTFLMI